MEERETIADALTRETARADAAEKERNQALDQCVELHRNLAALREENALLLRAIMWEHGYSVPAAHPFAPRKSTEGAYWWRSLARINFPRVADMMDDAARGTP